MVDIYSSSDYAGASGGPYSFYYGYEYGKREVDGKAEEVWGFIAHKNNEKVLMVEWKPSWPDKFEVQECLLYGIANFLEWENKT